MNLKVFMKAYTCVSYTPSAVHDPSKWLINFSSTGQLQEEENDRAVIDTDTDQFLELVTMLNVGIIYYHSIGTIKYFSSLS